MASCRGTGKIRLSLRVWPQEENYDPLSTWATQTVLGVSSCWLQGWEGEPGRNRK